MANPTAAAATVISDRGNPLRFCAGIVIVPIHAPSFERQVHLDPQRLAWHLDGALPMTGRPCCRLSRGDRSAGGREQ